MSRHSELTEKEYWDKGYLRADKHQDVIDLDDFRQLPEKKIIEIIEKIGLAGKKVLEVGAGNSYKLVTLAKRNGTRATFFGLDYSEAGCEALRARASVENLDISVLHADMFAPPADAIGQFDVVYSIGVVEHFENLDSALASKKKFLKPAGAMFTLIPNMSGILGLMTKRWNDAVYKIHNPHDLDSLVEGHLKAGLTPIEAGYLCSTNFGVLSSCFESRNDRGWKLYVGLSRLSKTLWFLESKLHELPKSSFLSPYIYVISKAA